MFWFPLILSAGALAIGIVVKKPAIVLGGLAGMGASLWYMTHPQMWQ